MTQNSLGCPPRRPAGVSTMPARPMGDIASVTNSLEAFGNGVLSSPWLYVGAALLVTYLIMTRKPKRRRRRKNQITPFIAAVYAAGAGAGGYLIGKYSGI